MKKKTFITLGAVVLVAISILIFTVVKFLEFRNKYSYIITANWDIKLPAEYEEIYAVDSGPSFLGDGDRYHIFKYGNNEEFYETILWNDTSRLYEQKNMFLEEEVLKILKRLEVPKKNYPDFKPGYKYYFKAAEDSSMIYLIYKEEDNIVYIIEDIR